MTELVHEQAKKLAFDEGGAYWATVCGKRLPGGKPTAITSNRKDVTCPKCGGKR